MVVRLERASGYVGVGGGFTAPRATRCRDIGRKRLRNVRRILLRHPRQDRESGVPGAGGWRAGAAVKRRARALCHTQPLSVVRGRLELFSTLTPHTCHGTMQLPVAVASRCAVPTSRSIA